MDQYSNSVATHPRINDAEVTSWDDRTQEISGTRLVLSPTFRFEVLKL